MTEKQYRLNKWSTMLLKNNRPLFDWTNESDEIVDMLNELNDKNEQLKQRIKSRLHYYRELCNEFDKDDEFIYNIVKRIVEDLEDILK